MPYFGESPLERVVDVHWKKKKPDEPPGGDTNPPYCGHYGWGTIQGFVNPGLISALPYGRNQFIPFVGTFSTTKADPVYGGLTLSNESMMTPVDTITAAPYGLHAISILLQYTDMVFTNGQLMAIPDLQGRIGQFNWTVPMAYGQSPDGAQMVIKTYTINMAWHTSNDAEWGLGITHPWSGAVAAPPAPFVVFAAGDGAASYTYQFKVKEWLTFTAVPDAGNQHDPDLGGPGFLWWMSRRPGSSWSADTRFMLSTLIAVDDWYTWEIVGSCQPMPNLFG